MTPDNWSKSIKVYRGSTVWRARKTSRKEKEEGREEGKKGRRERYTDDPKQ
jgi:hypothetical protein